MLLNVEHLSRLSSPFARPVQFAGTQQDIFVMLDNNVFIWFIACFLDSLLCIQVWWPPVGPDPATAGASSRDLA